MGGGKFLGNEKEPQKDGKQMAFEMFCYWVWGGLILSFGFAIIVLPKPNFLIPILIYLGIGGILLAGYLIQK